MNFSEYKRNNDGLCSNYRLRDEPVNLSTRIIPVFNAPGTESWENEGGALPGPPYEETVEASNRAKMRVKGARKQRAAKLVVPRNTITVVPIKQARTPEQLEDKSLGQEIQVRRLEAQVARALGMAEDQRRAAKAAEERKVRSLARLQERFRRLATSAEIDE